MGELVCGEGWVPNYPIKLGLPKTSLLKDDAKCKVGLTVSKEISKSAVKKIVLKRWMRESIAEHIYFKQQ